MKRITVVIGIAISVLLLVAQLSSAQIPQLIRYQGKLNDSQGVPLEGPYNLTFRIYDVEASGEALWTETQDNVPISQGFFNVLLGQVTPLDLPFDKTYWLSIQVNSDEEMAPRQQITSVSYAFRAKTADSVDTITPTSVNPQGAGSGLDADMVDGYDASDLMDLSQQTGTVALTSVPQGPASGLHADILDNQHGSFYIERSNHTGTQSPSSISPQGSGSTLDADKVDGWHKDDLIARSNHTGTQSPTTISPQGSGSGLAADTVDGLHASSSPEANKLLAMDGSGKIHGGVFKVYDSGWFPVSNRSVYSKTHNLGTTKLVVIGYFSASSDGTNPYIMTLACDGANEQERGLSVLITTTKFTINTTGSELVRVFTGAGSATAYYSGYLRIIALALE